MFENWQSPKCGTRPPVCVFVSHLHLRNTKILWLAQNISKEFRSILESVSISFGKSHNWCEPRRHRWRSSNNSNHDGQSIFTFIAFTANGVQNARTHQIQHIHKGISLPTMMATTDSLRFEILRLNIFLRALLSGMSNDSRIEQKRWLCDRVSVSVCVCVSTLPTFSRRICVYLIYINFIAIQTRTLHS